MRNLTTTKENTWCRGCGNFGLFAAVKRAIQSLQEDGVSLSDIVMTSGIGCHGKIFDYLNVSGIYGLHGRALATAQGIKLANPDLQVITFGGDGDSLGEGLEHTLFAAKRNMDITLILHNNGTYGLTTGQASPLSQPGYRGLSTPHGNVEMPFVPVTLLLEAGASFVARSYTAKIDHLTETICQAVRHRGFSFVEVLQPCVSYHNTYQLYNDHCQLLTQLPESDESARALAKAQDKIYLGVFCQKELPLSHEAITSSQASLSRAQRIALLDCPT